MSYFHGRLRLLTALLAAFLAVGGMTSCRQDGQTTEEARVKLAFAAWKTAMINAQTDLAMTYIPGDVDAYLSRLNSGEKLSVPAGTADPAPVDSPVVNLFLRTALEKKVPPDLRSRLTLDVLVHRVIDKRLLNLRDIRGIDLGRITINGRHASAELYYHGALLPALRLPFVKEGATWKIDVLAILPYAELLMRVDRAITGETEAGQVDKLVDKLPSL